jgi:hypothetical protein
MDDQIQELADAIYADQVRRARAMTVAERMETGIQMFEDRLAEMRRGFRVQFPNAADSELENLVRGQLDEERRAEEAGLFYSSRNLDLSN